MDFSETREWRTVPRLWDPGSDAGARGLLAPHARGLRTPGGGPAEKVRPEIFRPLCPEVDANLYTVDELLELSPEPQKPDRLLSQLPKAERGRGGGGDDGDGRRRASPGPPGAPALDAGAGGELAEPALLAAAAPESRSGSSRPAGDGKAEPSGVADGQTPWQDGNGHSEGCSVDKGLSSFFARRAPEEYTRLDVVESSLTVLLRRQAEANREDAGADQVKGVSVAPRLADLSLTDASNSKTCEVRVHLPPYDSKDSVLVLVLPSTMRVADLHREVVRQHADRLGGVTSFASYVFRLYDEDEQEPDFDCPPFDRNLQVGCLNVSDLALCPASSPFGSGAPPSRQLSCAGGLEAAASCHAAITPEALGSVLARKVKVVSCSGASAGSDEGPSSSGAATSSAARGPKGSSLPIFQRCDSVAEGEDDAATCLYRPDSAFLLPSPLVDALDLNTQAFGAWPGQGGGQSQDGGAAPSPLPPAEDDTELPQRWQSDGHLDRWKSDCPACVAAGQRQSLDALSRPSPAAFFFSEYSASIATEYFVMVAPRGSRGRPVQCTLVVDRGRLRHQVPRGHQPPERPEQRKSSFIAPLLKNFSRHLQHGDNIGVEPAIFVERCVRDICTITRDESHGRAFSVVYSASGGGAGGTQRHTSSIELAYEAQTPTECSEIIARLRFLMDLLLPPLPPASGQVPRGSPLPDPCDATRELRHAHTSARPMCA